MDLWVGFGEFVGWMGVSFGSEMVVLRMGLVEIGHTAIAN